MDRDIGIDHNVPHLEALNKEAESEVFGKGALYMTDFTIKHAAQDAKDICLNALPAIVLKIEQGNRLRVETIPPNIGRQNGLVELPFGTVKCVLSIGTDEHYMGHTFITRADLDGFTSEPNPELQIKGFEKQMTMANDLPSHSITFTVTIDKAEPQCGDDDTIVSAETNPSKQLALGIFLLVGDTDRDLLGHKLLNKCGDIFLERFTERRDQHDLDCSLRSYDLAAQMIPTNHPDYLDYQFDAATGYYNRFQLFEKFSDIDRAQSMFESAINRTPEGHPKLPSRVWIQVLAYQARFEYTKYLGDLSSAISSHRKLIELLPESDADLPAHLNNLGLSLKNRFEQNGDIVDISESISLNRRAIRLLTAGAGALPAILGNLGLFLQLRFEQGGDITDLSGAISSFRDAIKLTPAADTEQLLEWQTSLAVALKMRFENSDENTDILEAILLLETVIKLTPEGRDELSVRLGNLGLAMLSRFEHATGGQIADLSRAISSFQQAIDLTPDGDSILPARLNNLGNALRHRFDRSTNPEDLSKAVSLHRRAIELSTANGKNLHSWLTNLGVALIGCFEWSGDIGELSEAVSSFRKAVMLTPRNDPCFLRRLNNLGYTLLRRFKRNGVLEDLSEAITLLREATESPSDTYARFHVAAFINNLALALQERFELTGDTADIFEAITQQHKAIELTPPGHAYLPSQVDNLGLLLLNRFDHSKDLKDVSEAITSFQEAVRLSHGRSSLPAWLNNLAIAFRKRFELTGNVADLSEAISSQEEVIRLTPEGHSDLCRWHDSLGRSVQALYTHTNDKAHIASAISHYRQAAVLNTGVPSTRLTAARKWAQCSQQHDSSQTLEAYGTAINLLSETASMNMPVEARHASLGNVSNLASAAAAAAFSLGRVELAFEWLEQGRCIVWTQLSQLRNPLHDLRAKRPDLAERLQLVSSKLEKSGSRDLGALAMTDCPEKKISLEEEAIEHIKHANEWNQLLEEIRREPEFSDFLRARKSSEILSLLPLDGPVVLINVHEHQCHVLVLIPPCKAPVAIQLQRVSHKWAVDLQSRLMVCLSAAGVGREVYRAGRQRINNSVSIRDILRALWIDLVKPIFDVIGFHEPSQNHRRIRWCATGPLAFLPIHAAGIYGEGGVCVSDFAISSYIPKIATLIEKTKKTSEAAPRILLVSQAEAPELPLIPGADTETESLLGLVQGFGLEAQRLAGKDATIKGMKEEMSSYSWIHLACHATQHLSRPLKSSFHLLDGQLDVSEIIKLQLPNADLAFLSACQTSTGDSELPNEAVHLAAGMLAAGYGTVISTMWSIQDEYGPEVAESFYSYLLKRRGEDSASAAHAIHHATQRLRKKLGDTDKSLLAWVPYVHFGI